jgi:ATP-dependent helicase/nuclease subunit B
MSLARHFLGFAQPALSSAADYLIRRYQRGSSADMSNAIVVLPGRRAARRLLEILVEVAHERGLLLVPPTLETVGQLPEHLYRAKRPFASRLTQQLVWACILRDTDRTGLLRVVAAPTATDDVVGWVDLGQSVAQLHTELAADGLDFRDVAERGRDLDTFGEFERWATLRELQSAYLATLDSLQLWDAQTARLVAIKDRECQIDRDVVVLGAVDMPQTLRQMLGQVAERVTVLVHAPEEWADRFDDDGCLVPAAWPAVRIPLDADRVHLVDGPADVADMVARSLAAWDGRYRADEITIGLADETITPYVSRQLHECGIAARPAVGKSSSETAPYRLFAAIEAYLRSGRYAEFAALVRHPDVSAWIEAGTVTAGWLERLDDYYNSHLQARLSSDWLGDDARARPVRQVVERAEILLGPFLGAARPWNQWNEAVRQLLLDVYGDRAWDRQKEPERVCLEVFGQIHEALTSVEALPPSLIPTVDAATAIQLTLRQIRAATVSSRFDPEAIELLGWLELPLDDAAAMVVCSFNEGHLPSSVNADAFLPNSLRSRLGLQDNARRYARDAYALSVLSASRRQLDLIVARHDRQGDPLSPSRLLFATERDEIARRALRFFSEPPSRHELPPLAGRLTPGRSESGFVVPRPAPLAEPIRELPVTAFRDYLTCPYRFYLRRVLKLQCSDDTAEELDGGLFGSLAHDVLRQFGLGPCRDSTDPDEIRQHLRELLQQGRAAQFGRHPLASVQVQLEQLRLRLDRFADKQAERAAAGWMIESAEGEGREHTDAVLDVGGTPMILRGRIDRIDVHRETGQRAILDYKSSDAAKTPEKAHQRGDDWTDLQLPLYRHLARSLGITGPVQLGYVLLPKDVDKVEFCMAQWTDDQLAAADEVARKVVRLIWDEEFWPPTDPAPDFSEEFAAICQDRVFEKKLAELG